MLKKIEMKIYFFYEVFSKIFSGLLIVFILISFLEIIIYSTIFGKSVFKILIILKFKKSYNLNFNCNKFFFEFLIFLDLFFNIFIFLLCLDHTGLLTPIMDFLFPTAYCMDMDQENISDPFIKNYLLGSKKMYFTAVAGNVPLNPEGQLKLFKEVSEVAVNTGIFGGGTFCTLKGAKIVKGLYGSEAGQSVYWMGSYITYETLRRRGVPDEMISVLKK